MTLSARVSKSIGRVTPIASAARLLMTNSNFVGWQTRRAAGSLSVAACALALASCTSVTRIPYTQQEQAAAVIPGIPGARIWADDPAVRHSVVSRVPAKQPIVLALS